MDQTFGGDTVGQGGPPPHFDAPMGFQSPPHNIEAEQALLGAIMVNNLAYEAVETYLKPEHFYEPVHRRIFQSIVETVERGVVADHITLKALFDEDEALRELNGARYLGGLAAAAITILNADDYGRVIFDLAQKRAIADICREGMNAAMMSDHDVQASHWKTISENVSSKIESIGIDEPTDRSWSREEMISRLATKLSETKPRISSGYDALDAAMDGGFRYGDLYGVEAPAKSNKTTIISGIYENIVRGGVQSHFFSLEMHAEDILMREVCGEMDVSFGWMEDPANREEAISTLFAFQQRQPIQTSQKFGRYDHVPGITISDLIHRMTASLIDHGTKVFVIDYFTKIMGCGPRQMKPDHFEGVAETLSNFCKANDVTIIIALQQNRQGEALWSDGIKRECSFLVKVHKVEVADAKRPGKTIANIWLEVADNRHGPEDDIGSEDDPAFFIGKGPTFKEIK